MLYRSQKKYETQKTMANENLFSPNLTVDKIIFFLFQDQNCVFANDYEVFFCDSFCFELILRKAPQSIC